MRRHRLQLVELPDGRKEFGWMANGLPSFPFGLAPKGLATRRQLRAAGLCPGGHAPVAQIVWRRGKAWAGLYDLHHAKPKRVPTLAQRRALAAAMAARRRCTRCGRDAGYCLPRPRTCWTCTTTDTTAHAA
ncbi:RRQRL motif-containing zinc-binding protein [Saccharopolyspora sp. NPDC000359]|uniref:RRQRL motif-containing zinc-binding protein n=1 Tax=Saccharopolyspora sp. NPDC000359 TaxID=3154251 RepID=UPI003322BC4F